MNTILNEAQIFSDWAPIIESKTGIKDRAKLTWLSKYCHFHALNESYTPLSLGAVPGQGAVTPGAAPAGAAGFYTNSTGSGDKWPSLLPLAIQVAARTVGFDIVPVVPMQNPSGVLAYLDTVYAGGQVGSESKPIIIKIDAPNPNVGGVSTPYAVGTDYWGVSAAPDGTNYAASDKAVKLTYLGESRVDGYPIFKVGATYVMSGTGAGMTADGTVKLSEVFDGSAVIAINTASAPDVTVNDTVAVTNRASLVNAIEDHIAGFAGAGNDNTGTWYGDGVYGAQTPAPMGRGVGESTYYNNLGLKTYTKFVEAETFQAAAAVTTEQIQDLGRQYGIDVVSIIENQLVNEISQNINKHILDRAFSLGWTNNAQFLDVNNDTLNERLDGTTSGTTVTFKGMKNDAVTITVKGYTDHGSFENQVTKQRRLFGKIMAAQNIVMQRGRLGPGNFVVTNAHLASALADASQYMMAPMANTLSQAGGTLYPQGTVCGMPLYVDPNMLWDDTRILVGRKGEDAEPGIKFMPYLMAESIQTIAEGTMAPKIAVKSRYALVEAGHHPQTQYYTFYVYLGTKSII